MCRNVRSNLLESSGRGLATRVAGAIGLLGVCLTASLVTTVGAQSNVELVEVRKIWDWAPHNAFTDLLRFKGKWFCVFREGNAHVSPDGALRVIA